MKSTSRETIFSDNREGLHKLVDPEGIPIWIVRTHHRHRREIPERLRQPDHAHLNVVVLRRSRDAKALLARLGREAS